MSRTDTRTRSVRVHAGGAPSPGSPKRLIIPSVASRNWTVSTPASVTGTSTNDWPRLDCQRDWESLDAGVREGRLTFLTVSK